MRILITGGARFIQWNKKANSTGQVGSSQLALHRRGPVANEAGKLGK